MAASAAEGGDFCEMTTILKRLRAIDGEHVFLDVDGVPITLTFRATPGDMELLDAITAMSQRIAVERRENELDDCMEVLRSGGNPADFSWRYQTQVVGLRTVFRRVLWLGMDEMTKMAPAIAAFRPPVFASLIGIALATATDIVSWARGVLGADQTRRQLTNQAMAEIG